jgi:hypothetical protein
MCGGFDLSTRSVPGVVLQYAYFWFEVCALKLNEIAPSTVVVLPYSVVSFLIVLSGSLQLPLVFAICLHGDVAATTSGSASLWERCPWHFLCRGYFISLHALSGVIAFGLRP